MAGRRTNSKAAAGKRSGRGFLLALGITAAVALLLRFGVWAELGAVNGGRNSVYAPSVLSDLATYMKLGHEIAAGEFSGPFYYQPFYYAVFLPICYLLSGGSVGFAIFVQSLLGAATVYLAGLASARLFGKRAGIATAILAAISTPLLLYTPFHQNETLQAFNLTLLFYLTIRACDVWNLKRWAGVGAITGVAILTRGNINLFLPVILGALIWAGRARHVPWGRIATGAGVFLALTVAVQLPFIIHNSRLAGKLTGPSTAADAVLGLGNSPEAPAGGRNPGLPAGPMEYPEAYGRMMALAGESKSVASQMFDWMLREPGAFFELQFRKLLLFWDYREIPNNVSLYGEGEQSMILRYLLPGRSILLIPLGLAGLLLALGKAFRRKNDVALWLLPLFVGIYWGAVALFYILSRFRAPILPLVAIGAGCFIGWAIRRWRIAPARRKELFLRGGLLTVAMFWLCSSSYDFYRAKCEPALMRLFRPDGTVVAYGGPAYRLDYGPMTFGDWREVPLERGTTLTKRFSGTASPHEVQWTILCAQPGRIRFRVNGIPQIRELDKPGFAELRFPMDKQEFTIEVTDVRGEQFLLYDAQRNYSRSTLNNIPLAGEWLMRLYNTAGTASLSP